MKLYKAVDKLDGELCMFLVYGGGKVAVMEWYMTDSYMTDSEMVHAVKGNADRYLTEPAERFSDAIDPVLIAEW